MSDEGDASRWLYKLAKKALKMEIESDAGRINLVGMILVFFLAGTLAVSGALEAVLDFVLALSGKDPFLGLDPFPFVLTFVGMTIICMVILVIAEKAFRD